MRKMTNGTTTINVIEFFMVKNMWEYYVTDHASHDKDVVECFVNGDYPEIGDVYMPEVKPYIITKTTKLEEVMPAPGWTWVD